MIFRLSNDNYDVCFDFKHHLDSLTQIGLGADFGKGVLSNK
jgi:hypothetical protein